MVARRKVRRARRRKSFSINLLETGAGLAFLQAADAGSAAKLVLGSMGGSKVLGSVGPLKLRA
jgi:hypothetical protein